jgi:4-methylaminobutanoate oxidase (formaldehyde-forming)
VGQNFTSTLDMKGIAMTQLPSHSRIVIIGGGIVGASVAYHLALRGESDVLLLERDKFTSGTTWHAAGLVGQLRATRNLTQLAKYTSELFATLEDATGQATGFLQRGSLSVARTEARFEELRRQAAMARVFGLDVQVVTPGEIGERVPLARTDDLVGGVFLPGDGQTNPIDTTMAFVKGCRAKGQKLIEDCPVEEIIVEHGRAVGVRTAMGDVRADIVVNCAGMWGRELADKAGAVVPLFAAEHFYIVTEEIPAIDRSMPVMRDTDGCAYFKEEVGKLMVGWFEPKAKPWGIGGVPKDFTFGTLPPDFEHIEPLVEMATQRMPVLGEVGIQLFFNGPESFTPDDRYLLGESPDVKGLWVAAGFNSIGIQSAGGAGKVLADWIMDGEPPMDIWDVDVRRMMPFQRNATYLKDRTVETLGLLYAMHWPYHQPETARGARRTPVHDRVAQRGAAFGTVAGWERANWYAPDGVKPEYEYSYGRQNWFPYSGQECHAVRTGVALFDQSSFAKFQVDGPGALRVLNQLSANNVDVPTGRVVYTQWLNDRGGIEADLTVTRIGERSFLVVTAAAAQVRDLDTLRRAVERLNADDEVVITDVTSAYATFSLMGPHSRELLQTLTPANMTNEAFPFATSRHIDLGYASVRATRITYVGELGWELYIPTEFATNVFDVLMDAGERFDLKLAGYHALDSLRMEKAYRHWGHDISPDDTPLEAGLGFAVSWKKPDGFIGRDALERQRTEGLRRRLAQFVVADPDAVLLHNEPILRNGVMIGETTSAAFGHTLGKDLALGYVSNRDGAADDEYILNAQYQIDIGGTLVPASVTLEPLYDPTSARIRS